ncbi:MAG: HAD hydrolase family protein [Candidatus Natronoplasma sp.]
MKKSGIKLIAVDLDGTLISDGKISPENRRSVLRALEKDIPILPATTRIRLSTSRLLNSLPIDDYPLVCNNGARVLGPRWMDGSKNDELKLVRLKEEIARTIAHHSDEKGYKLSTVFPEKVVWMKDKGQEKDPDPKVRNAASNLEAVNHGTPVGFMMHRSENGLDGLKDLENFVKEEFGRGVRTDRHHRGEEFRSLSVYDGTVCKSEGSKLASERLDISLKEVLAIGDDEVDKEMIEKAGTGIAMGDAPLPVKKIADDVAPDCEHNGVAWALNKFLLK